MQQLQKKPEQAHLNSSGLRPYYNEVYRHGTCWKGDYHSHEVRDQDNMKTIPAQSGSEHKGLHTRAVHNHPGCLDLVLTKGHYQIGKVRLNVCADFHTIENVRTTHFQQFDDFPLDIPGSCSCIPCTHVQYTITLDVWTWFWRRDTIKSEKSDSMSVRISIP